MAQNTTAPSHPDPKAMASAFEQVLRQCNEGGTYAYVLMPERGAANEVTCDPSSTESPVLRNCVGMGRLSDAKENSQRELKDALAEAKRDNTAVNIWNMGIDVEEVENDILPRFQLDLSHINKILKEMYKDPVRYGCPLVG
jgi:hypothetical protein